MNFFTRVLQYVHNSRLLPYAGGAPDKFPTYSLAKPYKRSTLIVNPSAISDETSPLYGMPIINAYEARTVFVLKRGKGTGFSGVENPLFTNDNTIMIYGDAKATVSSLVSEFTEE